MNFIYTTTALIILISQTSLVQSFLQPPVEIYTKNNIRRSIASNAIGITNALDMSVASDDENNCPMGYFRCNSTDRCVPQHNNCDGVVNCDDGSDEWNCTNDADTKYWDHMFRKQPFGSHDDILIGNCAWQEYNVSCPCRGNDILCRFLELTILPTNLEVDNLDMLDLTGNNFTVIDEHFFDQLPFLDSLVLKSCSITTVTSYAFQRLAEVPLKTLYLDENYINNLPRDLFPTGNQLKILILSGNRIQQLYNYTFCELRNLEELDLRTNEIETFEANVFENLINLEKLFLNGNKIQHIHTGMFPKLLKLHTLSLTENRITKIDAYAFTLPQLQHLFLAANYLTAISAHTFCHLNKLKGLHLNENMLQHFDLHAFDCLENLTSLLLTDNKFYSLEPRILQNLANLNYIYFSWFHLCRAAWHVRVCEPKTDGISTKHNLLENPIQRGAVWFMTVIAIAGNIMVIVGRCFYKTRRNAEHSLYLRHLAFSDLIMGIYLAIIAYQDIHFRNVYLLHDEEWRHSIFCDIAGFLNTLSCQSSTLLLTLVTWDRLMSVTRPLHLRETSRLIIGIRLAVLWGLSVALAVAPLCPSEYFGSNYYGSNGVCLSIHIHNPYAQGWEYSALLFIGINSVSLLFISVSYMRMLQAILNSSGRMRSTVNGRHNQILTTRFAIIIITDCFCWLPIIVVKVVALAGFRISLDLYAWLAVLVLPMNSALNPILYTLTTTSFKQQLTGCCFDEQNSGIEMRSQTQIANESGLSTSVHNFTTRRSPSRRRSPWSRVKSQAHSSTNTCN